MLPSSEQAVIAPATTSALGEGHTVVKLRGLPWGVTPEDIATFLSPIGVPEGGVHLMNGGNGRPSGIAYVELNSEDDQKEAVAKDKQSIGGRYIDVFPCSQTELQARLAGGLERGNMTAGAMVSGSDSEFVKLRGLPYSVQEHEIISFFQPLPVIAVQVAYNQSGQPSGFGFVQFRSSEDANAALGRSNQVLGSRYVEIFRCTRVDMEQVCRTRVLRRHSPAASALPSLHRAHLSRTPVFVILRPTCSRCPCGSEGAIKPQAQSRVRVVVKLPTLPILPTGTSQAQAKAMGTRAEMHTRRIRCGNYH